MSDGYKSSLPSHLRSGLDHHIHTLQIKPSSHVPTIFPPQHRTSAFAVTRFIPEKLPAMCNWAWITYACNCKKLGNFTYDTTGSKCFGYPANCFVVTIPGDFESTSKCEACKEKETQS